MRNKHKKILLIVSASLVTMFGFQNCSNTDYKIATQNKVLNPPGPTQPDRVVVPDDNNTDGPCVNCGSGDMNKTYTQKVAEVDIPNKVDILVVVDNSGSMEAEMKKLQERFNNLVSNLEEIDWRIAVINTDIGSTGKIITKNSDPAYCLNTPFIAKPERESDNIEAEACFKNRILMSTGGSGDERAIRQVNFHLDEQHGALWMREDAHFAIVVLSDEDERSVTKNYFINSATDDDNDKFVHLLQTALEVNKNDPAGALERVTYTDNDRLDHYSAIKTDVYVKRRVLREYVPTNLKEKDYPESLAKGLLNAFPDVNKTLSFHSIVTTDLACLNGAGENMGELYMEASRLLNGFIADICSDNYSSSLSKISSKIKMNVSSIQLDCLPVADDAHPIKLYIDGRLDNSFKFNVKEKQAFFVDEVAPGTKIELKYYCEDIVNAN